MPFVLFKEGSPDAPRLARLYGIGATTGIVIYYEKRNGRTYFIALLAEGECDGIDKVYFKGFDLPEFADDGSRNWRFHPGTKSNGFADPVQGRPEFFPAFPTCLSEKAYIEVALSRELSEGEDEPTSLKVIMRGTRMLTYEYDAGAQELVTDGVKRYSVNPADEFLDIAVTLGGVNPARFNKHGATWQAYKNRCAGLINWQGGNVYVPAAYDVAPGLVALGDGALRKTAAHGWNGAGTKTTTAIPANTRGGFKFKVSVGSVAVGLATATPAMPADINVHVGFGDNGSATVWFGAMDITDSFPWLPSDEWEFRTEGGLVKLFRNGVEIVIPPFAANVNLYGAAAFYNTGATVSRSRLLLTNTARQVPRYTGHFAFAGVDVPSAIAALMIRTFGCDWYDVNGGIGFFDSPVRPVAHRFSYDPTQALTRSNQVRGKFNFTVKDDEALINFWRWSYRNLDDPLLTLAYEYTDRAALRAAPFNAPLKQSEVVSLGVSNQSEVQRIGEAHARYFTDLGDKSFYVEGQADSYGVTKGSVVELTHDTAAYRESAPPKFLVTEDAFLPGGAGDKGYVVVPYNENFYDDTAQGAVQQVVVPDIKSPLDAPPPAVSVLLNETGRALPDGTYMPVIQGTVTFDSTGQYPQRARVWWKKPTDAGLVLTSILLVPNPATYQAGFELEGVTAGAHQVQVITESLTGVRLTPNFHRVEVINATGSVTAPNPPASLASSYDNGRGLVRWAWGVSPDNDIIAYQLTDAVGTVLFQGLALEWYEPPTSGTMTRRVYSINRAGIRSTLYQQATYTHGGAPAVVSVVLTPSTRADAQGGHTTVINGVVTFAAFARNQRARVYVTEPSSSERRTEIVLTPDGANQAAFTYLAQVSGSYTFRVVTEDDFGFSANPVGVSSSTSVSALTVPPPTSYTLTYDAATGEVVHRWSLPTPRERVAGIQIATDAGFTNVLYTGDASEFRERITVAGTYTRFARSVGNTGNSYSTSVSAQVTLTAPAAPAAGTHTYDNRANVIVWNFAPGDANAVSFYEFDDNAGKILDTPRTGTTTEVPQYGVAAYTRRVRAVNAAGLRSGWTTLSFTIPTPAMPTAGTHTYDGRANLIAWQWSPGDAVPVTYEFDDNAGRVLDSPATTSTSETPQYGVAAYTRRVRALNAAGIASAWRTLTFTIPAPAVPVVGTHAFSGEYISWRWTPGDTTPVTYQFDDGASLIDAPGDPVLLEQVVFGTTTYNRRVRAVNKAGIVSAWLALSYTVSAPATPTAGTHTYNNEVILWQWTAGDSSVLQYYEFDDGVSVILGRPEATRFEEVPTYGTSSYTRRVRAVNRAGAASAWRTLTFTIPAPSAPTGYAMTFDGERLVHQWSLLTNLEYEVASDAGFTVRLWRGKAAAFVEVGFPLTSRVLTRYVRAINNAGIASTGTSASVTVTAPAAPTLTKDATRQYPQSLVVHLTTGVPPTQVVATVVQVRSTAGVVESFPASTAQGTDRVFRYAGRQTEIDVPYKAGGAMELRVSFEDKFTPTLGDNQWSTALAHTFPKFLDVDIDPNSNLARQYAQGTPMMSGGGTIAVSAGAVVSWSAGFVVAPVHTSFAPNGRVDISANAGGTLLAANQVLVARHTLGTNTAPTLQVFDLSTYVRPDQTSATYDFWLAHRRSDGKFVMYNGAVLNPGETMLGDTFIPYLTVITAMIANLAVTDAKVLNLSAQKIIANTGDFAIIFADRVASRNFVSAFDQTAHAEPVEAQAITGGTFNTTTRVFTKTAADGWGNAGYVGTRAVHVGDASVKAKSDHTGVNKFRYFGLAYPSHNNDSLQIEFAVGFTQDDPGTAFAIRVFESGVQRAIVAAAIGDTAEVAIESGVVKYYRTTAAGVRSLLYTSAVAPRYPLKVVSAVYFQNDYLEPMTVTGVLAATTGKKIRWQNLVGVAFTADGADDLTRTVAGSGWGASSASSVDVLAAGQDGAVEAIVDAVSGDTHKTLGFSITDAAQTDLDVKYGAKFGGDGLLYAIENGVQTVVIASGMAINDVIRVERAGGVMRIRRNGVIVRTFATTTTSALIVDSAFYTLNAVLKSARLFTVGARPQGIMLDMPNGTFEFGVGGAIAGYDVRASQARAALAIDDNLHVRGNDFGVFFRHKLTGIAVVAANVTPYNEVIVQLSATIQNYFADAYNNDNSIFRVRVHVLNQFGEIIYQPTIYTSRGDGVLATLVHSRQYADPALGQAIYGVEVENSYGWSLPRYLRGTVVTDTPTTTLKKDAPLELNASAYDRDAIAVGWFPAVSQTNVQTLYARRVEPSGHVSAEPVDITNTSLSEVDSGGSIAGTAGLSPDTVYDVFVTHNKATPVYSNVVRVKTPPSTTYQRPAGGGYVAPLGLIVSIHPVTKQVSIGWQLHGDTSATGLPTGYDVWRNGVLFSSNVGAGLDTTAVAGTTYSYKVRARYTGSVLTTFSNVVTVTVPVITGADPTDLKSGAVITTTRIDFTWLNNLASGAVTFQYKAVGSADDPNSAAFWSSGVTTLSPAPANNATSASLTGLNPNTRYAARVKLGTSQFSNVASVNTAPTITSDPLVPTR